jgi:hypothetical protein
VGSGLAAAAAAAWFWAAPVAGQAPASPAAPPQPEFVCPDYSPIAIQACGREHAKTFMPPRTAEGRPDFSGYWGGSQVPHESLEEHPKTADDNGGPSALVDVPDGKVPIQPWAEAKRLENKAKYIDQNAQCFMSGVPRHLYMGQYQFVQTPARLVLLSEEANAYRTVFLDGRPHIGKDIVMWQGDSRGRWEGDVLVVDTRFQNGNAWLDQQGRFLTDEAVVTERFTMFEPNSILYEATIDDPVVYTRPFTIVSGLRRNTRPGHELWEEACYEGESNTQYLRNIGYRTYPGFSAKQAREAKDAFERRHGR